MKHFRLGKTIEISSLDKKPYPTLAGYGIRVHNPPVTRWWLTHLGEPANLTTQPPRTSVHVVNELKLHVKYVSKYQE